MAKAKVLNVLKNMVGSDNIRVEHSSVYLFVKAQNAFVFFINNLALGSYKYDKHTGWEELENDIAEYGY
jgi:hypothetical protein